MEYLDEITFSEIELKEYDKLLKRLKKKRPRDLDDNFQAAHQEAFEDIDCLKCANCCKTTSPIFRDVDVQRIAKKFRISALEFENQYLNKDSDGDWVLKSTPCTFLNEDNSCFIYDVRPQACKEYPHTDRKRVAQIMDLTRNNLEICPAVSKVVEKIKKTYS